jgi:hypothetical protein
MQHRWWVRMAWDDSASTQQGPWRQLLTIPVDGYLEASGGPVRLRDVEWVEVSMCRINGGMAGRPLRLIGIRGEVIEAMTSLDIKWDLHDTTWSKERLFQDEPVQVARIGNPFR